MITIGQPVNMSETESYGWLDMSMLSIYFRHLVDDYVEDSVYLALKHGKTEDPRCKEKRGKNVLPFQYSMQIGSF